MKDPQALLWCPDSPSAVVQSPACVDFLYGCSDTALGRSAATPRREKPWKHPTLHSANASMFAKSTVGF